MKAPQRSFQMKSDYIIKPVLDLPATGANIKNLMKKNGMTVRSLQDIFEAPYPQAIYNWLSGKNMPSIDNLVILAEVFGVPVDEIVVVIKE
jgi:transcriptional regulator with XRE-family HTH domain